MKLSQAKAGCVTLGVEIPPDTLAFLDSLGPKQLPLFDALKGKQYGGVANMTLNHGDFRLDNIFFKVPGSDEVPVAFIDFQLLQINLAGRDPMYFLMNSVPEQWRAENELKLLNAYYDALIQNDKVPASYTWEVFMVECVLGLAFSVYNPVYVGADTEIVKPGGTGDDPRKLQMIKTGFERYFACATDWGLSDKTVDKFLEWAAAGATEEVWAAEASAIVPEKYLKGREV